MVVASLDRCSPPSIPSLMADSEDELQHSLERPAKRQKQFTFQRFAQRVAQVRRSYAL
jgi:hypothetical protein